MDKRRLFIAIFLTLCISGVVLLVLQLRERQNDAALRMLVSGSHGNLSLGNLIFQGHHQVVVIDGGQSLRCLQKALLRPQQGKFGGGLTYRATFTMSNGAKIGCWTCVLDSGKGFMIQVPVIGKADYVDFGVILDTDIPVELGKTIDGLLKTNYTKKIQSGSKGIKKQEGS